MDNNLYSFKYVVTITNDTYIDMQVFSDKIVALNTALRYAEINAMEKVGDEMVWSNLYEDMWISCGNDILCNEDFNDGDKDVY